MTTPLAEFPVMETRHFIQVLPSHDTPGTIVLNKYLKWVLLLSKIQEVKGSAQHKDLPFSCLTLLGFKWQSTDLVGQK